MKPPKDKESKKAFDTVDHKILLRKLTTYCFDEFTMVWSLIALSSYLPIKCGVPQGSIVGPLMLILYINDMDRVISDCSISLHAADTALYYASSCCLDLILTLRDDIDSITQWLNLKRLTLNTKKTKYMIFGTKSC